MAGNYWVVGGTGGSGTRAVADYFQQMGLFIGRELNESLDAMPFARLLDQYVNLWWQYKKGELADFPFSQFEADWHKAMLTHTGGRGGLCLAKNPRTVLILDLLWQLFPDMKFIHIIRNGAAMAFSGNRNQIVHHAGSILDRPVAELTEPEQSLLLWCKVNALARAQGTRRGGYYACIRYEDFCVKPAAVIANAAAELDVNWPTEDVDASRYVQSERAYNRQDAQALAKKLGCEQTLRELGYPC